MAAMMYKPLAILSIALLLCEDVSGSCTSCSSNRPAKTRCSDPYVPPSAAYTYCGKIDMNLCKKYGGGYTILCEDFPSWRTCSRSGSWCSSSNSYLYRASNIYFVILSVLSTCVFKMKL